MATMHVMENPKVAAVIVTYQNPAMLADLLDDLFSQSTALNEVIVIDNSADDRTANVLGIAYPGVVYRRMPENVGSAGGFYEGIRMAVAAADYVLTLDDDVRMSRDAVANLLEGMKKRERQGIRVGAVRAAATYHPSWLPEELHDFAWRGTLLSRIAIDKAGLPTRDYFLYGDDLEYSVRMAKSGFRFFWVPSSVVDEVRKEDKVPHTLWGRSFFIYRDDFRLYYALRNQIHADQIHHRYWDLFRTVSYGMKVIAYFSLCGRKDGVGKALAILRGVHDGFRSRLGKRAEYHPAETPAETVMRPSEAWR